MKRLYWNEKVDMIVIYSRISIKQIQKLLDVGQPSAIALREAALVIAKDEGRWVNDKKVPTDLLLKAAGLDFDYFKAMAQIEKSSKDDNLKSA